MPIITQRSRSASSSTPHTPLTPRKSPSSSSLSRRKRFLKTFAADPWKVLIATIFLNVTNGTQSIPIVHALLEIWDTPEKMAEASPDKIYPCIRHLGLGHSRSKRIVGLSRAWIARPLSSDDKLVLSKSEDRAKDESSELGNREWSDRATNESSPAKGNKNSLLTRISHLPGVGRYALDSFRIFCTTSDEWKSVRPTDKELVRYLAWKWAYQEHRRWHPERGSLGYADAAYIERLITNLAVTTPGVPKPSPEIPRPSQ
ncbi:DNA glycosylase [Schizophyllum commune]